MVEPNNSGVPAELAETKAANAQDVALSNDQDATKSHMTEEEVKAAQKVIDDRIA